LMYASVSGRSLDVEWARKVIDTVVPALIGAFGSIVAYFYSKMVAQAQKV
jgi:hypothetical protein